MDKSFLKRITDCLGSKEERYFSNGFKSIDVIYNDVLYKDGIVSSNIHVKQRSSWSKKNGRNLKPHLGTTEFVSISAVIAQHLLEKEFDLYQDGYKFRDHTITDIILDEEKMNSRGNVTLYEEDIQKKGIGAKYDGMILTDYVLVTGQLTQALLYSLNNSDREKSNNMWLREIDVWCEFPPTEKTCNGEVKFLNMNTLNMSGETWQSVTLSGSLSNMNSKIKVAQKIN